MERCPFCSSEDIYYSKKRKLYVCEDCDETFLEEEPQNSAETDKTAQEHELFFSYGHDKNSKLVERIKEDLEKRGHRIWIDNSAIKAGDHWRNDILNGVLNAARVIAFLSEHSTRTPGVCLDELKIAVCVRGADIKTVLLEPEERIKPPATLADIQWLDMSQWQKVSGESETAFENWYKEKFEELCKAIESDSSSELEGEIRTLRKTLAPYINSEKEYDLLAKEFQGRKWLETYIEDWQDRKDSRALVVYGKPGSGKSAFCVNYSHYNSDVYGCFLCEWNKEYTISPNKLIRTIAFKLATKLPDYRSFLIHQLDDQTPLDKMDAEALFDFLLIYPLSHLVDGNRETGLIIVDGLDEADTSGSNPLAETFAKCVERLPRWIKFVFTSRPEKNIKSLFQGCDSIDIIEDMPDGYNDIMAYAAKALADELRNASNALEVLNRICELSEGVFLYAELLINDIKSKVITLNELDIFPKGLNAFYRMSMQRKFPSQAEFVQIREFLEVLSVADTIPEKLIKGVCGYNQYAFLKQLDQLGSWVNRFENDKITMLSFSHKSVRDWFTDYELSSDYFVDYKNGALRLARYCKANIESDYQYDEHCRNDTAVQSYLREHVGYYYLQAEAYKELEDFLVAHPNDLDPYWSVWNQMPADWDNTILLEAFWKSEKRNAYVKKLQREGNTTYLRWILDGANEKYGIEAFDSVLIGVYMDIVHLSGEYSKAVEIANQYLKGYSMPDIVQNEFLSMLSVRKIHHSMFYQPARTLLDAAMELYSNLDDRFPAVYNELLFLIGGNLGVLSGAWELSGEWLTKSQAFAEQHGLDDFYKRNARKIADCFCRNGDYEQAEALILQYVSTKGKLIGRYEAYLIGALANVYTCIGNDDEALECYEKLLKYSTGNGIAGWAAHADLGIGNVYFKLGNLKEAAEYASRAREIYVRIKQEWGMIMSEALLSACKCRMANTGLDCTEALSHASRMQYGSCEDAIQELVNGAVNYLKLYFL